MKILYSEEQSGWWYINNFKRKNSRIDQGSNPGLKLNALATQTINLATLDYLLLLDPLYPPEALVPSIRDGGEHI